MDLWLIFITGLTVGGLTCLVVQGGLLASVIASREKDDLEVKKDNHHPIWEVTSFVIAKFIAYTLLGFFLGIFGQSIALSDSTRATIQIFAGIYMILVAFNLFNLHPIFRYVIPQPPKFIYLLIRNKSKSEDLFAPALLGVFTIFIPCGTTLAMEALAISSANPLTGAMIMGVFTLATTPFFLGLGILTQKMGEVFKVRFLKLAAIVVTYLGLSSVNGGLIILNSPVTLQSIAAASPVQIDFSGGEESTQGNNLSGGLIDGVRSVDINIKSGGYSPSYIRVQKDEPVKLNLISQGAFSCALAFRIPALGIAKNLKPTGRDSVEFTPTRSGRITYACSMGMYTGTIEVI